MSKTPPAKYLAARYLTGSHRRGFTLAELMVVAAIIVTMMLLVAPAITSLKSSSDFGGALSKLAGKLEEGRTFAMANNTHVFVGIEEVDATQSDTVSPQTAANGSITGGRIAVATFASRDGTRVYDVYAPNAWVANYGTGSALTAVGKILTLENLHMVDFGMPPTSGPMTRPDASADYRLGNEACVSATPFTYPAGSRLTAGYKYYFSKVIEFDPQGTARIISTKNGVATPKIIEIGLQPTHQSVIPSMPADQNVGNHAAIQINAVTGSVRIYRP